MTKPQKSFVSIAAFEALMKAFRPSLKKALMVLLISFIIFLLLPSLIAVKVLLAFISYLSCLYLYSLNRLSVVKSDIEYLAQPHYDGFPVRQPHGGLYEEPDGFHTETLRLEKHYKERLIQLSVGTVLYVTSLLLGLIYL